MEIIRHLSNEELTDLVIQSDQQALRQTLAALPDCAGAATERPEEFWQQQRDIVWSRISALDRHPENFAVRRSLLLAWSAVAAMLILAALMLGRPSSVPPPRKAQVDPDHELLMAVEHAVHNDGPAALDPAALLADEMVQDLPAAHPPIRRKEPTHEN
ncbi:MAG: hypothetical protein ACRD23_18405 [Terriglobales bacterium]